MTSIEAFETFAYLVLLTPVLAGLAYVGARMVARAVTDAIFGRLF